ncbi:MAG: uracil-DNA glycosylase [Vicinamibacterales bacterium]
MMRLHASIVACERCPRLRTYCQGVARDKKRAYRDDTYWGRPVPGFGDADGRVLLLGLAPAAHGANRTGRVFTGDGVGGSGDFLMSALNRAGFANLPTSHHPEDGLRLHDVYIAAAVRCAPPDNKPAPAEITTCLDHLDAELTQLPNLRVVVALGRIAWDAWFQLMARRERVMPRPIFGHAVVWHPPSGPEASPGKGWPIAKPTIVGAFHPSRQNTNTRKLTPAMYDQVFGRTLPELLRAR